MLDHLLQPLRQAQAVQADRAAALRPGCSRDRRKPLTTADVRGARKETADVWIQPEYRSLGPRYIQARRQQLAVSLCYLLTRVVQMLSGVLRNCPR